MRKGSLSEGETVSLRWRSKEYRRGEERKVRRGEQNTAE